MKKLTISRAKWYRSKGCQSSALRVVSEGESTYCCLGFAALADGYTDADLVQDPRGDSTQRGFVSPAALTSARGMKKEDGFLAALVYFTRVGRTNNSICCSMMHTNDAKDITDPERESLLIIYARKVGIELEFVD